jgi:hypothetical protein
MRVSIGDERGMRKAIIGIGVLFLLLKGAFSQELSFGERIFPLSDRADRSSGMSLTVPQDSLNVRRVGRALFEPLNVVKCVGAECYISSGKDIVLVDVGEPESLFVKAVISFSGTYGAYDMYAEGSRIYVARGEDGLWILEKVNDEEIEVVGSYMNGESIQDVVVREGIAYITSDIDVLLLDVSDPGNIELLGGHGFTAAPMDIFVSDSLCYVANQHHGLRILDVSNPYEPTEVGYYDPLVNEWAWALVVRGDLAYLTVDDEIWILDVHDPQGIALVDSQQVSTLSLEDIQIHENYAYVREWAGGALFVVNVTDPHNMTVVSQYTRSTNNFHLLFPQLYLTGEEGLRIMDITDPTELVEVGFMDGNHSIIDVFVSGDYSYLSDGPDGLYILDTSDPALPIVISRDSTSSVSDVDIEGDYAYLACSTSQLRVLNVSDPSHPTQVSSITVGNAVSVDVVDTVAYVASGNGLHIVSVADIDSLYEVGFLGVDFLKQIVVAGGYAYLACGFDGMRIIDVSEPSMPAEVSRIEARDWTTGVDVSGNYAYMADGYAGVRVIDVSDPSHPVEAAYSLAGYGDQLHVVDPYLYLSGDYKGLHVLDISVPDSIHEVGYYTGIFTDGIFSDGDFIYVGTSLEGFFIFEFTPTGIRGGNEVAGDLPRGFALRQNYPNPFNPSTTISFEVPGNRGENIHVSLAVYDVRGRRVRALIDSQLEPGHHRVVWDGKDGKGQSVSSGVYIYTMTTSSTTIARKMVLLQ